MENTDVSVKVQYVRVTTTLKLQSVINKTPQLSVQLPKMVLAKQCATPCGWFFCLFVCFFFCFYTATV